jgi:hypothetical protein
MKKLSGKTTRLGLTSLSALLIVVSWSHAAVAQQSGWPREIDLPAGKIVIYQPQVDTFENNDLTARSAVSVTPAGKTEPVFGAVWFKTRLQTDRDTRMVSILELDVPQVRFPNATPEQEQELAGVLKEEIPKWDLSFSLDRLLTMLDLAEEGRVVAQGFNDDPPKILFVTYPAILVTIDGEPQLRDIENTGLKHVVNTPFLLVLESKSNVYYLYAGDGRWYTASQVKGPWLATGSVPSQVSALAPIEEEKEAQRQAREAAAEAGEDLEELAPDLTTPPAIIIATEPTELIVTDGLPEYKPLTEGELLYVSNTESDVLMEVATQQHHVLLSGRWFVGPSLEGPWTFVPSDELPASFQKIPADSDAGHLRVWVAGTEEAQEAVLDSQIPQTSAIKRDATIEVTYDGNPQFVIIEGTDVYYAVNSSSSVLRIKGKYYCAEKGVWYVADEPLGPWTVAVSVPREEIDSIPPESPVYNTKYVYIYESTPSVVYVGYYPGYVNSYVYHGCVVYGTGWYYRPWWGHYYYPRPSTWGFHVRWNPWYGWSFGFSYSTGRFTFGIGFGGWGGWYRGGWWGPARYRPYYRGYNRGWYHGSRAGYRAGYRAGRLDSRYRNQNIYNRQTNAARNASVARTRSGAQPRVNTSRPNNVYSDRAGNVHQRTQSGNWQTRSGNAASRSQTQSLNRSYQSRQRGTARTQSYRRSGGSRRRR